MEAGSVKRGARVAVAEPGLGEAEHGRTCKGFVVTRRMSQFNKNEMDHAATCFALR